MISSIGSIGTLPPTTTVAKPASAAPAAASDFSKVLADMTSGTFDALKAGEAASIGGIQGTVPTQSVVQAVMNAEQALQTAIAVRDKLVAAYTDISRMSI
jgi:flagellar hook-basal body complex protein FliE